MKDLSNAETALLGLLSERPMYPYQIEHEVKFRDIRFWTELSMSSIYKLLRKLEKEDFVERTNEISNENRLRKLYRISKKGEEMLVTKIESLLTSPEHIRWQVDIGIYNADLIDRAVVIKSLKKYKLALQEKIKGYKDLQQFLIDSQCPSHRFAVAERPIFLLQAEIQWIESYLERFNQN